MKSRFWILLLVAASAVPAFGQVQLEDEEPATEQRCIDCESGGDVWSGGSTYEEGRYLDNPCTAVQDLVWVDYSAYASGAQTAAGVNRYQFSESTTMSGSYATSGTGSADVAYGAAFSQRMYHKVNTSDDFHVVTVVNFDPATKAMTLGLETACGNGMPDSKE